VRGFEQPAGKACNVSLDGVVRSSAEELSYSHRTNSVAIHEITPEYFQTLDGFRLAQQLPQSSGHLVHSVPVIADNVIEIVSVFVVSAGVEGKRLQEHECPRTAHRDAAPGVLAQESYYRKLWIVTA